MCKNNPNRMLEKSLALLCRCLRDIMRRGIYVWSCRRPFTTFAIHMSDFGNIGVPEGLNLFYAFTSLFRWAHKRIALNARLLASVKSNSMFIDLSYHQ